MNERLTENQTKRTDQQRYADMAASLQAGWWESNLLTGKYTFSENIAKIFGIEGNQMTFEEAANIVCEDYRELFKTELYEFSSHKRKFYERIVPIETPRGRILLKIRLCYHYENEYGNGSFGALQVVQEQDVKTDFIKEADISAHLRHFEKVSNLLGDFINNKSEDYIIKNILQSKLDIYDVDYVFLEEFTEDGTQQKCVYEVCRDGYESLKPLFNQSCKDEKPFFINTLLKGDPLVIDDISTLPHEALRDYQLMNRTHAKSMMVVPLVNDEGVWGSIGVLSVHRYHRWTNYDYMWMLSSANIISICVRINRDKIEKEQEEHDKANLLKYMPIGYARVGLVRDDVGEVVDFIVKEANDAAWTMNGFEACERKTYGSEMHDPSTFQSRLDFIKKVLEKSCYIEEKKLIPYNRFCQRVSYISGENEIVVLIIDNSETIKAQLEARRIDKMFQNIFINIPIGEAIYDVNGVVKDMNKAFLDLFGLRDKQDAEGYAILTDNNMTAKYLDMIARREDVTFRVDYDFDKVNTYTTSRKGKASFNCKLFKLYEEEELTGFMLIVIEDTDKIMAIDKAHEFENMFFLISDYAKVGYAVMNLVDRSGHAIPQWYKNFGESPDTPINEVGGVYSKMHKDDRKQLLDFHKDVKRGKRKSFTSEVRVRRSGTRDQWNWLFVNILVNKYAPEEGVVELIGVTYDITAFKESEKALVVARDKAQMMDKLKSAFLANMSHEIRTPLNAIIGFSDLIVNGGNKEDIKTFSTIIHENSDLLLQLINDILDLSKMEVGIVEFKYTDVDVNALCEDIVKAMRLKAKEGVDIVFGRHDNECVLYTDRNRLAQVLSNFFTNALKFTSQGSIIVSYEHLDDTYIRFAVTDTGIGIKEADLPKVFKRFVKLNTFIQGTGLGLSICNTIVEQMGGKIGVNSEFGKGSTFWFTLPISQ